MLNKISILFIFLPFLGFQQDTTKIKVGAGPEDFVLDTNGNNNRLIISCDERRDWDKEVEGNIWVYNLNTKTTNILKRIEPDSITSFNPHGIHLLHKKGISFLFIVNHFGDPQQSEIRRYILSRNTLTLDTTYTYNSKINAVCAVSKNHFFFTNDMLFYGKLMEYRNNKLSTLDKRIQYPNGINILNDKLYLSTTISGNIYEYQLNDSLFPSKGKKIANVSGGDNIRFIGNKLLTTSHPSFKKFLNHRKDSSEITPTIIHQIDLKSFENEILFKNNGELIPAGSTAIIYRKNLYISQVFQNFILKIKL